MEPLSGLPKKYFGTIICDPPWPIGKIGKRKPLPNKKNHNQTKPLQYAMMTIDDIKELPIANLASTGAHVYLWTTNSMLSTAFGVLDKWGVRFHLCMPLVKKSGIAPCNGYVFAAEYCLLGFAGAPMQKFKGIGKLNWLLTTPIPKKHSCKPDEFYELVEYMSPGPYVDIFARKERKNWTTWGNETTKYNSPIVEPLVF